MEMEQQAWEEAMEEITPAQELEAQPAAPTQEELDAAKAQAEEYLNPVSYTHLDVYKRQHTSWTNGKPDSRAPPVCGNCRRGRSSRR